MGRIRLCYIDLDVQIEPASRSKLGPDRAGARCPSHAHLIVMLLNDLQALLLLKRVLEGVLATGVGRQRWLVQPKCKQNDYSETQKAKLKRAWFCENGVVREARRGGRTRALSTVSEEEYDGRSWKAGCVEHAVKCWRTHVSSVVPNCSWKAFSPRLVTTSESYHWKFKSVI